MVMKTVSGQSYFIRISVICLLWLFTVAAEYTYAEQAGNKIEHVRTNRSVFNPSKNEKVTIYYSLSFVGTVSIKAKKRGAKKGGQHTIIH